MDARSSFLTKDHGLHALGLCRACKALDFRSLSATLSQIHLNNCFDLIERAKTCRLCCFIAQSFRRERDSSVRSLLVGRDIIRNQKVPLCLALNDGWLRATAREGLLAEIRLFSNDDDDDGLFAPFTSTHTQQEQTRMQLSTALHQNRPRCLLGSRGKDMQAIPGIHPSEAQPLLPLRVLDIGDFRLPQRRVCLHVRIPGEREHYATLSHRWGGKLPLRTTRKTLNPHLKNVPIQSLPATFCDAIEVTRLLGIRYLWIDALCIIQDDKQDWETQAAEMGAIYQHSLVTIAVHSARNSSEGFLWRRDIPDLLRITRESKDKDHGVWVKVPPLSDRALFLALHSSEITRRAWVAQEMSLSPRILHFIEDKVFWECHCSNGSCYFDDSEIELRDMFRSVVPRPSENWLDFLKMYSSCQMTKTGDKLPAMTGIAKSLSWGSNLHHPSKYYCGIFDNDVYKSLLWYRENKPLVKRVGRAPSWSWASVDGEISFEMLVLDSDATIMPTMEVVAFECGCGNDSQWHTTCNKCTIQLKTLVGGELELGFPEKKKRFSVAPLDGPRKIMSLFRHSKCVGWALFDSFGNNVPILRYIQTSCVSVNGERKGYFVIIVKPVGKMKRVYSRVGVGYIFCEDIFHALQLKQVTLI